MLNPFIHLISNIISLVNLALVVWIILGLLLHFDIVNRQNPAIARIYATLTRILDPLLRPIRTRLNRWLPDMGGVDLSPVLLLLLLHFIDNAMYQWFYSI
jgi:YggT family protein